MSGKMNSNSNSRFYKDGVFMVRAGGGGPSAPLTKFIPQRAEIKVGETVTWYNPTRVAEPHTVTFLSGPEYWAVTDVPFVASPSANLTLSSAVPGANADPILMDGPNGSRIVVGANARAFTPTAIGAGGKASYMPPNANYTMTGGEKYLNSGLIWPKGKTPQGLPPIESFSVRFDKEGTYNYTCLLHPWMAGQVVVTK
jgi:plastocyanin